MSDSARRALRSGRGFLAPEKVATVVVTAATTRRPRDRYKVGPVAHALPALRRWLPVRTWDVMVRRQAGLTQVSRSPAPPRRGSPAAPPGPTPVTPPK